jgi:hypothetical protein
MYSVFSRKIQEHKQVALRISMYKHLSCAAFKIKLTPAAAMPVRVKNSTTGSGSGSGKKPVCVCVCVQAPLLSHPTPVIFCVLLNDVRKTLQFCGTVGVHVRE